MARKKWSDFYYKVVVALRPIAVFHFSILVIFFIIAAIWTDHALTLPIILSVRYAIVLSLPFYAVGLFLMVWSCLHFIKAKGTLVPFKPPPRLVTTGPYAYVRNPMVAGVFIVMLGIGLLLRSISLIFVFTPLFIFLNVVELKILEEAELDGSFRQEYEAYKKKVPMFIPRWKRRDPLNTSPV